MTSKPDWLKNLEEEQSSKLIFNNKADEINLSHKRILDNSMPSLWQGIKQGIEDTFQTAEIYGMRFMVMPVGEDSVRVSIFRVPSASPVQVVNIHYIADKYKFEVIDSNSHLLNQLFVSISAGQLSLSNGRCVFPNDDIRGLAEVACQSLLEPLLRAYIA